MTVDIVQSLAAEALSTFAAARSNSVPRTPDSGPAVLATLAVETGDAVSAEMARAALEAWLDHYAGAVDGLALFGGLAGLFAGASTAASVVPQLRSMAAAIGARMSASIAERQAVEGAWHDYDLVSGPAGVVLGLLTDPECPPALVLPPARRLAALCADPELRALRVRAYARDDRRAWNLGRVNTGVAHGVGGVVAALRAAYESAGFRDLRQPLERACRWLVRASVTDARGVLTWPAGALGAGGPGVGAATRRQAWCYGTPGVAWCLWDAGRALDDVALRSFALAAMRSYCVNFDGDDHFWGEPGDALGVCHGAAGVLAIADAFATHADDPGAAELADRLEAALLSRTDELRTLFASDMTLLTGASGILSVLLLRRDARRGWLNQLALR